MNFDVVYSVMLLRLLVCTFAVIFSLGFAFSDICTGGAKTCIFSGDQVIDQWYSEIKKHEFNSERSMGTGKIQ